MNKITKVKKDSSPSYTTVNDEFVFLQNIYGTKLVIPAIKTISGKSYVFEKDEVKSVNLEDKEILLALFKQQASCCGGSKPQKVNYFNEVK